MTISNTQLPAFERILSALQQGSANGEITVRLVDVGAETFGKISSRAIDRMESLCATARQTADSAEAGETWRAVPNHEGRYEVSDFGRVRSLPRISLSTTGERYHKGRILRQSPCQDGYMLVVIIDRHGKQTTRKVHALVLEAFVGPRPVDMEHTIHEDGVRSNNRLSNIRWGTALENAMDRHRHGTTCRGESHGRAKLTEALVRDLRAGKLGVSEVVKAYGINERTVRRAANGQAWKHLA